VTGTIELYEDERSGWRVLTRRGGTIGYRFLIVDRAGRSTFAADATGLANGGVPAGLEQVDLAVDSPHGMTLVEPCALWSRGRVRRTQTRPGVLTVAYISGEVMPGASAGKREPPAAEVRGRPALRRRDRLSVDGKGGRSHLDAARIGGRQSLEVGPIARGGPHESETSLAGEAIVPVHALPGQQMLGAYSNGSTTRRRRTAQGLDTRLVVTQVTQLLAANEQLRRTNRELTEENERLRGELTAIESALGSVTGGRRARRGGAAAALALHEARQRRRTADPEVLSRRSAALARARAAMVEELAAGAGLTSSGE